MAGCLSKVLAAVLPPDDLWSVAMDYLRRLVLRDLGLSSAVVGDALIGYQNCWMMVEVDEPEMTRVE